MEFLGKLLGSLSYNTKENSFFKNFNVLEELVNVNRNMCSLIPLDSQPFLENHVSDNFESYFDQYGECEVSRKLPGLMQGILSPLHNNNSNFPYLSGLEINPYFIENKLNLSDMFVQKINFKEDIICGKPNKDYSMSKKSVESSVPKKSMNLSKDANTEVLLTPQKNLADFKKHTICDTFNLNNELTNRKTKKMQKRSRKRRRRQKKEAAKSLNSSSDSSHDAKSSETIPHSITKETDDEDVLCDIVTTGMQILLPAISSFLICVESSGEDESDFEFEVNNDLDCLAEFQMSGLFVTNLIPSRTSCFDLKPKNVLSKHLLDINRNWNKSTKDIKSNPRLPTKVTFAPDSKLVSVAEVEAYDRKGEWEQYARDRQRFKDRIQKVEEILAPYLSEQYRNKVLCNLNKL